MRDFIQVHAALILRFARLSPGTNGRLDPADVAQDVVVSLLRMHKEGSFDPDRLQRPEAYLRVVVRHAIQRAHRRNSRAGELTSEGHADEVFDRVRPAAEASRGTPEELSCQALDARRILEALKQRLRPRDALALALLVEDGLSIEATAQALGTTTNNVHQMRHRIAVAARELRSLDPTTLSPSGERS